MDTSFTFRRNADYHGALTYEDLTDAIRPCLKQVPDKVAEFKRLLQGKMPLMETHGHYDDPYECPFRSYCSQGQPEGPEYPASALPYVSLKLKEALKGDGIEDIRQTVSQW